MSYPLPVDLANEQDVRNWLTSWTDSELANGIHNWEEEFPAAFVRENPERYRLWTQLARTELLARRLAHLP